MDRLTLARRLLGPAVALLLATLAHSADDLKRSEDLAGVRRIGVTTTATEVFTQAFWGGKQVGRNEVCVINESTDTLTSVYVSTFSAASDASIYGWPIRGTEKECHDWGSNIPLWVWNKTGDAATRYVRFLIAK